MKLEEVLPEYRKGRKIKRESWGKYSYFSGGCNISFCDIDADDWELVPNPAVVIDLVQYAEGYEFVFGCANHQVYINEIGCFHTTYNRTQKSVSDVVYMNSVQADTLCNKLNSGEWVLNSDGSLNEQALCTTKYSDPILKKTRWRAKSARSYYSISMGVVMYRIDGFSRIDDEVYESGMYWETEDEAQSALTKITAMLLEEK